MREALDAFTEALHVCVLKVMGAMDPDEPKTQELVDQQLAQQLAPLVRWRGAPGRTAGAPRASAASPTRIRRRPPRSRPPAPRTPRLTHSSRLA